MPNRELNTNIFDYPMPKMGVNFYKNIVELLPEECLLSQNLVWKNGLVGRGGQSLLNTTQAVSSKKILGIHRFYYGTSKVRMVSCDTKILKDDEDNTWTTLHTWATGGLNTHFTTWGALDKEYVCNGTDRAISYDGTSVIDSIAPTLTVNSQPTAGQNSEVDITINGTVNTGVEGTEWDVGANEAATATDIASWLNGLTGITAAADGAVVTVTPAATTDLEDFVWDFKGSDTAAMATVSHLAIPAKTIQVLPYQDRLLSIDSNNPGELRWSASYDDTQWELRSNTGVRPDVYLYGMVTHSATNSDTGYRAMILLAGAKSMYLFHGTDLRPPSTTGDYTIYKLALEVGCNAPKSMVSTPKGTIWLGIDRQVYLLPFESLTPVPIGHKIRSNLTDTEGIESIPAAQIQNACATYHDGYYKLAIAQSSQTTNNIQFWLEIDRLAPDENGHFGPWYGPMPGQTISCFDVQSGPADTGELIGGESSTIGYIYQLHLNTTYGDITPSDASTKAISVQWKPFYHPLGSSNFYKDIHIMEFEMLNSPGTVNIDFHDITGSIKTGDSFSLGADAFTWGSVTWGSTYTWENVAPFRKRLGINIGVKARRLLPFLKYSSSSNRFELYSCKAKATEGALAFE